MKTVRSLLLKLKGEGRLSFGIENVAGFGIKSPKLPDYAARIYHESSLLDKVLNDKMFERSLEIGCGYGRMTPWIAKHSKEHHAIEPEATLLNDAKRLYPNVNFYETVAQIMPYHPNHFDLIVCLTVLMHIPPTKFPDAINEIKRVASENATIVLLELIEGESGWWHRHWVYGYEAALSPLRLVHKLPFEGGTEMMVFHREANPSERR